MKYIYAIIGILTCNLFASAGTVELRNDKVLFAVDENGGLVSLKNLETGREYAGGGGLWRIIYRDGLSMEELVEPKDVPAKAEKVGESVVLTFGGEFPVKITCTLSGDEIRFVPEIKNASKDKVLREFQFPLIRSVNLLPDSSYCWTHCGGEFFPDIKKWVRAGYTSYMSGDEKAIERYALYPGKLAMNFFVVGEPQNSLYVANYDPKFGKTLHFGRYNKKEGAGANFDYDKIDLGMVKYPMLAAGESRVLPEYVVSPHSGDWRVSAKKYRKWADTWYKHTPASKAFLASNGWQRVILRHQYGKVLFPYSKIPEIYRSAKESGMDTIRLYGWWKEGMDAGNPHYSEDDTQGGDAELKRQIRKVQEMGGKVHLYFNGQLIDTGTEFYKTVGKRISIKRADGMPYVQYYPFGGDGTALRVFGNKMFATGCPYTKEWFEVLKSFADRAIALGADGIYYDQIGHESMPCCDKSHGHPVPFMEIMGCKGEMFSKVCEYIRSKKPDMPIGIEWVNDPVAKSVDYVHNCFEAMYGIGKDKFGKPLTPFVPMYQYAFPEFKTCNLGILDNRDIVRRNNLSLMRSWRSDVAVYRCRATIDAVPEYKEYLKKINALRDKFRPLILNGVFRDVDMAKCSNPQIDYYTYTDTEGGKMAVVATQSHLNSAKAVFTPADGYEFADADGIGGWTATPENGGKSLAVSLKNGAIVVAVFKKAEK